jgi:hypothetical protein
MLILALVFDLALSLNLVSPRCHVERSGTLTFLRVLRGQRLSTWQLKSYSVSLDALRSAL